jgi:hypothetical protein
MLIKILFFGFFILGIPKKSIDLRGETIYFTYGSSCLGSR